jgi:hypothetical protein
MVSLLLMLLLAPFGYVRNEAPLAARPVICPNILNRTVLQAKGMLAPDDIDLKIKDPVTGLLRDPDPGGADDAETIITQSPRGGHGPFNDPVTGYYVAVILDPGGEGGSSLFVVKWTSWANLIVALLILWQVTRRPTNPKGPDPIPGKR